jgi:mannose/fructose-specific phosphotransferase system component IIA
MAHAELANSFVVCVKHILAKEIDNLHILSVKKTDSIEHILEKSSHMINTIGMDNEILILTDIFGATPSNIANKLLIKNKIVSISNSTIGTYPLQAIIDQMKTKEERQTLRSKTFEGMAQAFAEQWGGIF